MHILIKVFVVWILLSLLVITFTNSYADHNGNFVCPDGTTPVHDNEHRTTGLEDVVWYCNKSVDPTPFPALVEECCRTYHDPYNEQVEVREHNNSDEITTGFTGWKQVGDRMEHYRDNVITISYKIDDKTDMIVYKIEDGMNVGYKNGVVYNQQAIEESVEADTPEKIPVDKEVLDLRLRILQAIENILRMIFS